MARDINSYPWVRQAGMDQIQISFVHDNIQICKSAQIITHLEMKFVFK